MVERRTRKRFAGRHEALISSAANELRGLGIPAYTFDLSTGSARLVAAKSFSVGAAVSILIDLSKSNTPLMLQGEVKWLKARQGENAYEIGVEFRELTSPAVLALIRELYRPADGIPSTVV